MRNHGYGGPTVELYGNFWLCGGSTSLTSILFKVSTIYIYIYIYIYILCVCVCVYAHMHVHILQKINLAIIATQKIPNIFLWNHTILLWFPLASLEYIIYSSIVNVSTPSFSKHLTFYSSSDNHTHFSYVIPFWNFSCSKSFYFTDNLEYTLLVGVKWISKEFHREQLYRS